MELTASVSPPPKKRKDPESLNELEIVTVMKTIEHLNVKEKFVEDSNVENTVAKGEHEEDNIPKRLCQIFQMNGVDIQTEKMRRVGGGGKCGVNCFSIHTTGNEEIAKEI